MTKFYLINYDFNLNSYCGEHKARIVRKPTYPYLGEHDVISFSS